MKRYFYDSYAIIAYAQGSERYAPYFERHKGFTTFYNAMEVYYWCLRNHDEETAGRLLEAMEQWICDPQTDELGPAMKFKLQHKKRKLSYVDCLGYALAKKHRCRFLTGDKEFARISNVEFVQV